MNLNHIFICILLFIAISCQQKKAEKQEVLSLKEGTWRATFQVRDQILPFQMNVIQKGEAITIELINAEERVSLDQVEIKGDSIIIPMHFFNTEIRAKIENDRLIGSWFKNDFENYVIPFKAQYGGTHRFEKVSDNIIINVAGNWAINFFNEDGSSDPAVGVFEQEGNKITGTFLTPTGDYRYLEGNIDGNKLNLTCFDGEHAFLFKANVKEGQLLEEGEFWSGKHWYQKWEGKKDDDAALPDPSSLTFLKDGFDKLAFEFPDENGQMVSLEDEKYKDKVVIVQLFGTWCPNCMDETKFLAPFYQENKGKGLEIIGLAYERITDFEKVKARFQKMRKALNVDYTLLLAGENDKKEAAKTLPMLNHILAYPTTIFIDKKGNVRKIHTGFSGPGTGIYYEQFVQEFELFVEKLVNE